MSESPWLRNVRNFIQSPAASPASSSAPTPAHPRSPLVQSPMRWPAQPGPNASGSIALSKDRASSIDAERHPSIRTPRAPAPADTLAAVAVCLAQEPGFAQHEAVLDAGNTGLSQQTETAFMPNYVDSSSVPATAPTSLDRDACHASWDATLEYSDRSWGSPLTYPQVHSGGWPSSSADPSLDLEWARAMLGTSQSLDGSGSMNPAQAADLLSPNTQGALPCHPPIASLGPSAPACQPHGGASSQQLIDSKICHQRQRVATPAAPTTCDVPNEERALPLLKPTRQAKALENTSTLPGMPLTASTPRAVDRLAKLALLLQKGGSTPQSPAHGMERQVLAPNPEQQDVVQNINTYSTQSAIRWAQGEVQGSPAASRVGVSGGVSHATQVVSQQGLARALFIGHDVQAPSPNFAAVPACSQSQASMATGNRQPYEHFVATAPQASSAPGASADCDAEPFIHSAHKSEGPVQQPTLLLRSSRPAGSNASTRVQEVARAGHMQGEAGSPAPNAAVGANVMVTISHAGRPGKGQKIVQLSTPSNQAGVDSPQMAGQTFCFAVCLQLPGKICYL